MYRRFPDDLRPSRIATWLAHGGTAIEYTFPLILLLSDGGIPTAIGLAMMFAFHSFILFSVPMGVPLEWNVFTMYAGLFLFGAHADVSIFSMNEPLLLALMAVGLLIGPVLGNLRPDLVSFLPSMRYYAGNWGASQWLFRQGMEDRLDERINKVAPTLAKQLTPMFDEVTAWALVGRGLAFRAMHLHGRAFNELIPRAVDDVEAYDARDGEIIAGIVLGWNFGDGHLHHHQLLEAIQERCEFAPGRPARDLPRVAAAPAAGAPLLRSGTPPPASSRKATSRSARCSRASRGRARPPPRRPFDRCRRGRRRARTGSPPRSRSRVQGSAST